MASVERYHRPNNEEYIADHKVRCLYYRRHLNKLAEERVSDGPSNDGDLKVISKCLSSVCSASSCGLESDAIHDS